MTTTRVGLVLLLILSANMDFSEGSETHYGNSLVKKAEVQTTSENEWFSINPTEGFQFGGTVITLSGNLLTNLTGEEGFNVTIGPVSCVVKIWRNPGWITCKTLALDEVRMVGTPLQVRVLHENDTYETNTTFTYTQSPSIHQVYPLVSIREGGIQVTVTGERLALVKSKQMKVDIMCGERRIYTSQPKSCTMEGAMKSFVCHTPQMSAHYQLSTCRSSQGRPPRPTQYRSCYGSAGIRGEAEAIDMGQEQGLDFRMVLVLDGYEAWNSSMTYYGNPTICAANKPLVFRPYWPHYDTQIVIQGYHLLIGDATETAYSVTIGGDTCGNVTVINNTISCMPPEYHKEYQNSNKKLLLEVQVGWDKTRVGEVDYPAPATAAIILGSIIGIVCVVIVVAAFVVLVYLCKIFIDTAEFSEEDEEEEHELQENSKPAVEPRED